MSQDYYATLFRRIGKETWRFGMEQMVAVLLAIVTLALQIRYGMVRQWEWKPSVITIVWPYLGLVGVFLIYQFLRVPKLLYTEQGTQLARAQKELIDFQRPFLSVANFRISKVYREAIDSPTGNYQYHVFIHPEIQTNSPDRLKVKRYKLEFDFHGLKHFPREEKDVTKWEMTISRPTQSGAHFDLIPLSPFPTELVVFHPHEGWLHFLTDPMSDDQFINSRIRLFMETEFETVYAEFPLQTRHWWEHTERSFRLKPQLTSGC